VSGRDILVVAAHPDDEVLGCGGAIARHARAGDRVAIVIVGEGITSRPDGQRTELDALTTAARRASDLLGAASLELLGLPDNRLDAMPLLDLIQRIEAVKAKGSPDIVYTHHAGDLNVDHRRVHEAVVTAFRPLPGTKPVTLLFFEVPSSTEWQTTGSAPAFVPNWFIDIDATLDAKLAAVGAYASEMRPWPHPRSAEAVTHLARWRGASIGRPAAEAFMTGRHIE